MINLSRVFTCAQVSPLIRENAHGVYLAKRLALDVTMEVAMEVAKCAA